MDGQATSTTNREQFAAMVVRQLEKSSISCVLVGGACVSIYTDERYHSKDLDFISPFSIEAIEKSLSEIGFSKEGRYFHHPDFEFYVEFPSGPPGIGNEVPIEVEGNINVNDTIIKMFSPTQCVMDRLAAWYHWKDRQSLIHALWVAEKHPISLQRIRDWSKNENELEKYEEFAAELKKLQKS